MLAYEENEKEGLGTIFLSPLKHLGPADGYSRQIQVFESQRLFYCNKMVFCDDLYKKGT